MKKENLKREAISMLACNNINKNDIAYIKNGSHNTVSVLVLAGVSLAISYICYVHNMIWFSVLFGSLHVAATVNLMLYVIFGPIFAILYALSSLMFGFVFLEVSKTYKIGGVVDTPSDVLMGAGLGLIIFFTVLIWFHGDD